MNPGNGVSEASISVELGSQRALWISMAVLGFAFGALMLLFGVGAIIAEPGSAAWLAFGVVLLAIALGGLAFGRLALRLGKARPRFLVTPESLVVEHPGLRAP